MNTTAEEVIVEEPAPDTQEPVKDAPAEETAKDTGAPQKTGAEKRIGQLTRKYRQAERENAELRERFDALEKRIGPEPEPERPSADDFETASEYEDALFDWRDQVKEHKTKPKPQKNEAPEGWTEFEGRVDALKEKYPDIEELVFTDDYACTEDMMKIIVETDRGAEVAYHLANNTDEADRIAKLNPVQQARELLIIEQGLGAQTTSSAPEAPGHIRPGGNEEIDPESLTADQWRERREAEIRRRDGLE